MTKEEFMMEAALRLLSVCEIKDIPKLVKELTKELFDEEESKENEDTPLSEVLEFIDSRFFNSFEKAFEYAHLNTIGDLIKLPHKKILSFDGIGKKGLSNLEDILIEKYGIEY